ncbi:MGH1-like glycoside hydrolase domain-containing protein, partial [Enterococcus faecalis]
RVLSSDPGHLLWCGIVPEDIAPVLVRTLLSPPLWSGWGLRTLGSDEVAYNPVSYHNGSVWPHDTGLFAMGLARYGFTAELLQVA